MTYDYEPSLTRWQKIPKHLREGLDLYIRKGVPTGSGLRSILEDRPVVSVYRSLDAHAWNCLNYVLDFLYLDAPAACHGSSLAVENWVRSGGIEGNELHPRSPNEEADKVETAPAGLSHSQVSSAVSDPPAPQAGAAN